MCARIFHIYIYIIIYNYDDIKSDIISRLDQLNYILIINKLKIYTYLIVYIYIYIHIKVNILVYRYL